MSENSTEYMEWMKESAKGFVDMVSADSPMGRQVIEMFYSFTLGGFLKYRECMNIDAGDVQ